MAHLHISETVPHYACATVIRSHVCLALLERTPNRRLSSLPDSYGLEIVALDEREALVEQVNRMVQWARNLIPEQTAARHGIVLQVLRIHQASCVLSQAEVAVKDLHRERVPGESLELGSERLPTLTMV